MIAQTFLLLWDDKVTSALLAECRLYGNQGKASFVITRLQVTLAPLQKFLAWACGIADQRQSGPFHLVVINLGVFMNIFHIPGEG